MPFAPTHEVVHQQILGVSRKYSLGGSLLLHAKQAVVATHDLRSRDVQGLHLDLHWSVVALLMAVQCYTSTVFIHFLTLFMITQSNVLFTFIGGIVGVAFMAGLIQFTNLGKEHMRDMDASIDNQERAAMQARRAGANGGMHEMPDGSMMHDGMMMDPMSMTMSDMSRMLEGKSGDALDKAFIEGMIPHHQAAVDMAKVLQVGTKRPELQKMAKDIIDAQTREIEMMQGWQKEWFK